MMTSFVRIIFCGLFGLSLVSSPAISDESPREWTDKFMKILVDDVDEASDVLLKESFLGMIRPASISLLSEAYKRIIEEYGSALGYEFIKERKMGTRVMRLDYVARHQVLGILHSFTFYKPEDNWQLIHVGSNDDPESWPVE